jgi:UV DNA damage endonuclease
MHKTGYCCINLTLGENFRTMQLNWAKRNAKDVVLNKWKEIVRHNFSLLEKIINWNIKNNIFLYRISSDMVPFADHEEYGEMWRDALAQGWLLEETATLRETLVKYLNQGGRVSIHPGQFVSIGSPNNETRRKSRLNLVYHGELFDFLMLPQTYYCPINIHISNGTKGEQVVDNVYESLELLPYSVLSRLVFENEQNGYWNPININKHFPTIPITFDYHHYLINPTDMTMEEAVEFTKKTWPNNDPIQHWSEGRAHEKDPAHSDFITRLPDFPYDIEVEAKKKDLSILPFLNTRPIPLYN